MKINKPILILMLVIIICLLSLFACKQVSFEVDFIVDGKKYDTISSSGKELISMPKNPAKEGYTFDGWFWDEGTWLQPFTVNSLLDIPLASDMSVYAKFSEILSDYELAFNNIAKIIKTNAQIHSEATDGILHMYSKVHEVTHEDINIKLNLILGELDTGDDEIIAQSVIQRNSEYQATLSLAFSKRQDNYVKGTYTDYKTKSKGKYHIVPRNYYKNTNIVFDSLTWGDGYSSLANSEVPYRLLYENFASFFTEETFSMMNGVSRRYLGYGLEKFNFENIKKSQINEPISAIYCDKDLILKEGQRTELNYVVFPFYNAGDEYLTSSNNDIVSVSGETINAVKEGMATIIISTGNVSQKIKVTVKPKTNVDKIRDFLRENDGKYFDEQGNALDSIPQIGIYYWFIGPFKTDEGEKFAIVADYKYVQPTSLNTHQYIMYFYLNNDGNVIDQIYDTATGMYAYHKDNGDFDATNLNDYSLLPNGKLDFKFSETTYMKYLSDRDYLYVLNSMGSVVNQTINVLDEILSKNGGGWLDTNKQPSFTLTQNSTTDTTATFDCSMSYYFDEHIKSATLYSNGAVVRVCTDEFVTNHTLAKLTPNTEYTLQVVFAYNKNTGAGEQTVTRIIEFATDIAEGTPYAITYNANGGQIAQSSQEVKYKQNYTLLIPSKQGYSFDGWYCDGELIANSGKWTLGSDITLIAKWTLESYNISYSNVSGAINNNSATYSYGSTVYLNAPTKKGYTFIGWTTPADSEPKQDVTISSTDFGNKTFIANWQANTYTVTLDVNGGECQTETLKVTYNSYYSLPTATKQGYIFNGWYNNSTKYTSGIWTLTNDIVLTAKYTAKTDTPYKVEHYQQNANDDDYTLIATENKTGTTDTYVTPAVKNYAGFALPYGKSVLIAADGSAVVKYYYTRNTYKVTFVTNGGKAIPSVTHKYGATLNLPVAERVGYTFGGWFTNAGLSQTFFNTVMPLNNVTVYTWWQEETKVYKFDYSGTTAIVINGFSGTESTIRIPSYIDGKPVTSIGSSAFKDNTQLTKVTLGDNVTSIGNYAFSGCTSLTQFNSYNENEINVPSGVESIGDYAFHNISLVTTVIVPDTVAIIGVGAFYKCNAIESITLPFVGKCESAESYTAVLGYIFGYEFDYTTAGYVGPSQSSTKYVNTITGSVDKAIAQYSCYDYYAGNQRYGCLRTFYYYVPQTLKFVTITRQTGIPTSAFNRCEMIEKIMLPENVTSIGSYAFQNCFSLKRLNSETDGEYNLPTNLTIIDEYTFYKNSLVKNVVLGSGIISIGKSAFSGCTSLTQFNSYNENEINVPSGVESIGDYAFHNISLVTTVIVPDTVAIIGVGAFYKCNAIESITLPFVGKTATEADNRYRVFGYIFGYDCDNHSSIKNYTTSTSDSTYQGYYGSYNYYYYYIPKTIKNVTITVQKEIPANAFCNCDLLDNITILNDTSSIGSYAFYNCFSLKRLNSETDGIYNLPANLTIIDEYTFYKNALVKNVVLGSGIISIGNYAFSGCGNLNNINLFQNTSITSTSFENCLLITRTGICYIGEILYCYNGTMPDGYVLNVKPNTSSIYDSALKGQKGLIKVILPDTVKTIGNSAFEGCTSLSEVDGLINVDTIGNRAFYGCSALKDIGVVNAVSLGEYALYECVALDEIELPNVVVLNQYTFYGCTSLTAVNAHNVTNVSAYAFQNCRVLAEVTLPNVITIGELAFSGCTVLNKFNSEVVGQLILPDCCENVGTSAFENCKALIDINLASATVGSKVLANCIAVEKLSIGQVNTYLGIAFGTTSATGLYVAKYNSTNYYIPTALKEVTLTSQSSNLVDNYAFANLKSLTKVTLPNNVTRLGDYTFSGCVALQEIVMPTNLTAIGQHCFDGCVALTDVNLSVCSLQNIDAYAFQNCTALQSIVVTLSVTYIGEYAFNGCANLTINCEASEYPSDWDYNWNSSNCTVIWGIYTGKLLIY